MPGFGTRVVAPYLGEAGRHGCLQADDGHVLVL